MFERNFVKGRVVRELEGGVFQVLPFESDACASCRLSSCKNLGRDFLAKNSARIDLAAQDVVRLEISKSAQARQGFLALGAPILGSVVGWLFAPKSEKAQVLSALAGFAAGIVFVIALRRLLSRVDLPEIVAKEA